MGLLRDDFRIGGFKVIIRLQSAVLQGPQNLGRVKSVNSTTDGKRWDEPFIYCLKLPVFPDTPPVIPSLAKVTPNPTLTILIFNLVASQ